MGKCLSCCRSSESQDNQNCNFQPPAKAIPVSASATLVTCKPDETCIVTTTTNNINSFGMRISDVVCDPPQKIRTSMIEANGEYNFNMTKSSSIPEKRFAAPSLKSFRSSKSEKSNSSQGFRKEREYSETKINALFDKYKDPKEDTMLSEGIESFCRDLEVKPEEFLVLLLAWKFSAAQMCCFTRDEFASGCRKLRTDSISGIQSTFYELLEEAKDSERFKDIYRFTYKFGLESGQRILPTDMAIQLWKLVFSQREPPILCRWLLFLAKNPHVKGIPRDTWNMFLNFTDAVGNDLSNYDDMEAWPCLFDDFVEYENDQTNQNISLVEREF